ncbi:nitroreductase family deazaflavin-dependent oxidoreductase [Dactylosporangium sp. NPDC050688]|uniref:nitroreductase family deazaflavin-dependent oxidoreductase n=1 Tax=Dactylosporangium sp. NPDC050688 TaxID=3157217 RepID=UPI00340A3AE5
MTTDEPIVDSATGWVAEHIRTYVDSGGTKGHLYHGLPTLLLTVRGRRSGVLRRTALIYGRSGDDLVVVASNGGSDGHPAWYLNLRDTPDVDVQVGTERFAARARTATPQEKPALWQAMVQIFARYEQYQAAAARDIPVVLLERRAE